MTKRRSVILSAVLVLSLLLGTSVSAEFYVTDDNDGYYDCPVEPLVMRFSVTVPACLPIAVSETGVVTAVSYAQIYNGSDGAVRVTDIFVSGENGWSVVPYRIDMASEKVDSRQIGLRINNAETGDCIDGTAALELTESEWIIPRESSFPLYYEAVVSANSLPVVGLQVMTLYFVVGWA